MSIPPASKGSADADSVSTTSARHRPPTDAEISMLAAENGLDLDAGDLADCGAAVRRVLRVYTDAGEALNDPVDQRDRLTVAPGDDPWGAWRYRFLVRGASTGLLRGRHVAVKDNIGVRGVPLTHGVDSDGYVPSTCATVVDRVLDAGADVIGSATCEAFCISGGSHTSATGPVRNPYRMSRSSGGSSSGAAVLVATGECDLAIGSDQGGSTRIPSAWCGVVGMKPTFGLVPYTGAIPVEQTMDHLGPIARSVSELAALLSVLAGPDGLDPRQSNPTSPTPAQMMEAPDRDATGLRVAVVREGFARSDLSDPDSDNVAHTAIERYTALGATVTEVTVPAHVRALAVRGVVMIEGMTDLFWNGHGVGTGWRGRYPENLAPHFADLGQRMAQMPPTLLSMVLAGMWARREGKGEYYARAQNAALRLRAAYDRVLARFDVLAMPTVPMLPFALPGREVRFDESVRLARVTGMNTAPFNLTGHPAITVPCGTVDGLPVGMQLAAAYGGEATLLRAAGAYERDIFRIDPPPGHGG